LSTILNLSIGFRDTFQYPTF